jgi:hypothetical protein
MRNVMRVNNEKGVDFEKMMVKDDDNIEDIKKIVDILMEKKMVKK